MSENAMSSNDDDTTVDRFCSECGESLVDLPMAHAMRPCPREDCEREIHVDISLPGGGWQPQPGDNFRIPAGVLRISLDSSVGGTLFRSGVPILASELFFACAPKDASDFSRALAAYQEAASQVLRNSSELEYLDFDGDEEVGAKVLDHFKDKPYAREQWAMKLGLNAEAAKVALEKGEAHEIGYALHTLAINHAMLVFLRDMEDHVWQGYLANRMMHRASEAAARTPAEKASLEKLSGLFSAQVEATLHTWVHDGQRIGPRIGFTDLAEETLRAAAEFHLKQFERERAKIEMGEQKELERKKLLLQGVGMGVALFAALLGGAAALS